MFRPYLAVIRDSFREALASRVLWVLLGLITLGLGLLAPFGYRSRISTGINERDAREWPRLIGEVRSDAEKSDPNPAKHIVSQFDESLRKRVTEFKMPSEGDFDGAMQFIRTQGEFVEGLDKVMQKREFYDPAAWAKTTLASDELKQLLDQDQAKLTSDEIGRRNRLLVEAAYPDLIEASPPTSLQIRYLIWDILDPLPIRLREFQEGIGSVTTMLLKGFVGVIGLIVAIVVTAPIVPQMFDPGSLNLLLSKPVSRSLLFLSKFVGGCAFILLNSGYLIVGMWLILGVRFGVWNPKVLISIPVYLFMFAIYYTVSSLSGVLWRNAIVSIGLTVLFWLACFLVGVAKGSLEGVYLNKQRLVQLVDAGDTLMSVNEMGLVQKWDPDAKRWEEVFVTEVQRQLRPAMVFMPTVPPELRPVGPVYDKSGDQLISLQRSLRNGQMVTFVGSRAEEWKTSKGVTASVGATQLLIEPDGKLLVVSSLGLFRLEGDPRKEPEAVKLFGFALPRLGNDAFKSVGPTPPIIMARPMSIALNPDSGELAIYSRGKLTFLEKQADGQFARRLECSLFEESSPAVTIAYAGSHLLLGRDDGRLILYDAKSGTSVAEFNNEGKQQPRFVAAAPGGRHFAAVYHDGHLWYVDAQAKSILRPRVGGQGDVAFAQFTDAGHLRVVDWRTRVTSYDTSSWSVADRKTPTPSLVESIHRYVLVPLYTIFPKPGDLDDTVDYLLSGKTTVMSDDARQRNDLTAAQTKLDPWGPVWSSALFMAVTLALGCLYLERQEF